jgi:C-terminal processing protease CtpA/Prc
MVDPLLATRLSSGVDRPDRARRLTPDDRRTIVRSLSEIIGGLYTHLPQKRARYGLDPIQQLRLLGERVADQELGDAEFHASIGRIFTELRDAHTRYLRPGPPERRVAVLPILVERYVEDGTTMFTVSKVTPTSEEEERHFARVGFAARVTITHWNGVPIGRAVSNHADLETAGRPDARLARALESLTIRPRRYLPPPDEDWVTISFTTESGEEREVRLEWRTVTLDDIDEALEPIEAVSRAYDPTATDAQMAKKMLFATGVWASEQADDADAFAGTVSAREVTLGGRTYGHLRLYNFGVRDDQAFIDHVVSLIAGLPPIAGLIIDLRANPGGNVWAAEGLLQLFSPNPIEPTLFTLVASDMTRAMAQAPQNRHLDPWTASLHSAVSSGASHAEPVALTPTARCNNRGQVYGGPVVAIVDANTYSAGDLFAAGFVDNRIGYLVSTDAATGGGGANVWTSSQVRDALRSTPFRDLELAGAEFTLSMRQALRYGRSRAPIEDVGVEAQFVHATTKRDLTENNDDLLAFSAQVLETEPRSSLDVEWIDDTTVRITSTGLDHLQLELDGIVHSTANDVGDRPIELPLPPDAQDRQTEIAGFCNGRPRQRRRLSPGTTPPVAPARVARAS